MKARAIFAIPTLVLELGVILASAVMVRLAGLPDLTMLAFAPTAIQAIVGTLRLHHPTIFERVGITSTIHAAMFVILVIAFA